MNKIIMVLTVFLVGLLSISAVSAETDAAGDILGTDSSTDAVESTDGAVLDSSAPEELQNEEKDNDINKLPNPDSNKLEMGEGEILGKDINVTGNSFIDIENAISRADNGDFLYLQGKYYKGIAPIVIDKNITIIGGSKGDEGTYATLDAQKLDGIFVINSTVTLQGIKFTYGHSTDGGAIYVNGGCTLIDCIFKDNYASGCGGAVYWNTNAVGIINCTFEDNNAWVQGGANYFNSPVNNVDLTGNFIHNSAELGGANYFYSAVTNANLTCNFINNTAREDGGANYFLGVITNVTFTCNFTGNRGEDESGANHFYGELTNVTLAGNFTDNTALSGGANRFRNIVTNVVLTANFFSNSAKSGGANYFLRGITNSIITGNFTDNHAGGTGGANYFGAAINVNLTGNFIHNTAGEHGGANNFYSATNVILAGDFINNSAVLFGGANRFSKTSTNVVLTGAFIDNSGEYGGANFFESAAINVNLTCIFNNNTAEKSGGANYFDESVTNVTLTGKYINNTKSSVIFIKKSISGNVIRDSIFINNGPINVTEGNITAVDNWFGNNATDYNVEPDAGIDLDNWLFLNGTADPNPVLDEDTSNIVFKLSRYDGENITEYDNSRLIPIELTITSTLGSVDPDMANLDDDITYTPDSPGIDKVTASFENVLCTIEMKHLLDPEFDAYFKDNITYGEDAVLMVEINEDANGTIAVYNIDDAENPVLIANVTVEDALNGINITGVYGGNHSFNIKYSGDDTFTESECNVTLSVEKADVVLTADKLEMYVGDGSKFTVVLKDSNGKPISNRGIKVNIAGKTYTIITNASGVAVLPINLKGGSYQVYVWFNGDSSCNQSENVSSSVEVYVKSRITSNKDLVKKQGGPEPFKVRALDKYGKPVGAYAKVKMTVASKTYTVFTDANGYASLPINLKVGKYKITTTYGGTTVTNTITVKSK